MAAFATNAQMLARYDARILGDLVGDLGAQVSAGSLATDPVLMAFLEDASGLILAACLRGEKYSEADLVALTGNSEAHLVRITCDLAMAALYGRRYDHQWMDNREKAEAVAEKHLERLRRGEHVFDVDGNKDAGLPDHTYPSLSDSRNRQGMREAVRGYFTLRRPRL